MTIYTAHRLFLAWLATHGYRPASLRTYQVGLRAFAQFWGSRSLRMVSREAVELWLSTLHQEGATAQTRRVYLNSLRQFGRWAVRQGLWQTNVAQEVDYPRNSPRVPRVPAAEDVQRLLAYLQDACTRAPSGHGRAVVLRDRAMVELAYAAALRPSELVKVGLRDIAVGGTEWYVIVRDGKGGRSRTVPFGRAAREALVEYLRDGRPLLAKGSTRTLFVANDGREPTYWTWRDIMRRLCKEIGLDERIRPHQWRHRAATDTYLGSGDIFAVAKFLGHVGLASVQVYANLEPNHLQEWYAKAHPRA